MHVIAGKAVAFGEALKPEFKQYIKQVITNAKVLSETLVNGGLKIVSGGTDTHLIPVDLTPMDLTGDLASTSLEEAHITCNKNGIPKDPKPPKITSGIRLGTPAGTTRGFGASEFTNIGNWIADVLEQLQINGIANNENAELEVKNKVIKLCENYPIY